MTTINAAAARRARVQRGLDPSAMAQAIGVPVEDLRQIEEEGHADGGPLEESAEKIRAFYAYYGGDVRSGPSS
jgi:ribosome-binding protein aMBF1 (putative translation factor)